MSIELLCVNLFPKTTGVMHSPVHVEVMPRPVQAPDPLPFEPALGIPIGRKNRVKPIIGGASGHLTRFASEKLQDERIQIRHLGYRSKRSVPRRQLVLNAQIYAARVS